MSELASLGFEGFAKKHGLHFERKEKYWRIRTRRSGEELLQGFPHRRWVRGFLRDVTHAERRRLDALSNSSATDEQPQYRNGITFHMETIADCEIVARLVLGRVSRFDR